MNSNWGQLLLQPAYYDLNRTSGSPICIDCSNILLTENNLQDIHQNILLEALHNSGHLLMISDLGVLEYIKNKYPNFLYIISDNIDLIHPLDLDTLEILSTQDFIYLINLPKRFNNDIDFLKNLPHKNKYLITIGNRCGNCSTDKQNSCKIQEQKNQYDFSGFSVFENCQHINKYLDNDLLINEIKKFKDLGFQHFKIDAPAPSDMGKFQLFLINSFIKPEYVGDFLTALDRKDIKNG